LIKQGLNNQQISILNLAGQGIRLATFSILNLEKSTLTEPINATKVSFIH
jgi:hypothetical protein